MPKWISNRDPSMEGYINMSEFSRMQLIERNNLKLKQSIDSVSFNDIWILEGNTNILVKYLFHTEKSNIHWTTSKTQNGYIINLFTKVWTATFHLELANFDQTLVKQLGIVHL